MAVQQLNEDHMDKLSIEVSDLLAAAKFSGSTTDTLLKIIKLGSRLLTNRASSTDDSIIGSKILALDTETERIKEFSDGTPELVCVSMLYSDSTEVKLYRHSNIEWIELFFDAVVSDTVISIHNAAFDLVCIINHISKRRKELELTLDDIRSLINRLIEKATLGQIFCSKVYGNIEKIADPRAKGFAPNLASLMREMYMVEIAGKTKSSSSQVDSDGTDTDDSEDSDPWRLRYGELIDVELSNWPEEAVNYASADAMYHMLAFYGFVIKQRSVVQRTWKLQVTTDLTFRLASWRGVKLDKVAGKQYKKELIIVRNGAARTLYSMGLLEVTKKRDGTVELKKKRKVLQGMIEQLGKEKGVPIRRTKTGQAETKEVSILMVDSDKKLQPWLTYSGAEKLLGTYIPIIERGIAHPNYNVLVETYRSSCKNPSVQTLPRKGKARQCFIPRPGYIFIGADFDTAELCSLSNVMYTLFGGSVMGAKINEGLDPHLWMASKIEGITYEEAIIWRKESGTDRHNKIEMLRQLSKALNFGYPGGLGAGSFIAFARGYGVDVSLEESTFYKELWMQTFSDMPLYFKYINSTVGGFGRRGNIEHPITKAVRGGCTFTQAANFLFQHLTAVQAKHAWNVASLEGYDSNSALYGFRSLLFIHDEIIGEIPIECAADGAARLATVMQDAASEYASFVRMKASPYIMDKWYKGAKAVYKDGKLVPFVPNYEQVEVQPSVDLIPVEVSVEELE